jgi:hypothetical protein
MYTIFSYYWNHTCRLPKGPWLFSLSLSLLRLSLGTLSVVEKWPKQMKNGKFPQNYPKLPKITQNYPKLPKCESRPVEARNLFWDQFLCSRGESSLSTKLEAPNSRNQNFDVHEKWPKKMKNGKFPQNYPKLPKITKITQVWISTCRGPKFVLKPVPVFPR